MKLVLFGVIGGLGCGKTLTCTFLLWKNWFYRRKRVFANYHLFKIPYYYINDINQFTMIEDGFVGTDELWRIIDSRTSLNKRNKFIADILARSRKRHLNYTFTAQVLDSLDKRIRKILDFVATPVLNTNESMCWVNVYRTGNPKPELYLKTFRFKTAPIFQFYTTDEEVDMDDDESNCPLPKPIFQESEDAEPIFFDSWEEADKYAEQYWVKNRHLIPAILG